MVVAEVPVADPVARGALSDPEDRGRGRGGRKLGPEIGTSPPEAPTGLPPRNGPGEPPNRGKRDGPESGTPAAIPPRPPPGALLPGAWARRPSGVGSSSSRGRIRILPAPPRKLPGSPPPGSPSRPDRRGLPIAEAASSSMYTSITPRAAPVSTPSRVTRRPSFFRVAASVNWLRAVSIELPA